MDAPTGTTASPPRSPRKRLRTDDGASVSVGQVSESNMPDRESSTLRGLNKQSEQAALLRETEVGIKQYVSANLPGFDGMLKKRYTDFLVNEIHPNGTVVHLESLKPPKPAGKKQQRGPATETKQESEQDPEAPDASNEAELVKNVPQETPTADAEPQKPPPAQNGTNAGDGAASTNATGASAWREYAEKHNGITLSAEDRSTLESFLGESETNEALALYNRILESPHRKPAQYGTMRSAKSIDRATRTDLHQAIRRIFASRLESFTEKDGTFVLSAASANASGGGQKRNNQGGRNGPGKTQKQKFDELGGDYVQFSLYKENKDTMEVMTYLARSLGLNPKVFQFAGTKDRRAITVQRASAYRVMAPVLSQMNSKLYGAKVGNFSYGRQELTLGDLSGNEFVITLRECSFPGTESLSIEDTLQTAERIVGGAMKSLTENGFINYYGMQRFGTFSTRTDKIGTSMLQGDYESAVNKLLDYNPEALKAAEKEDANDISFSSDDKARAKAIDSFLKTGKSYPALDHLPRKFSGESNVIRYLGDPKRATDFLGAIQCIPRSLRLMYIHAYQSIIWNHAASHRWALGGAMVLEGDLVLMHEHKDKEVHEAEEVVDANGEPIVRPGQNDRALTDEERFERARALTKEEAESGQYVIHDIVLPSPGFDVLYPAHMVKYYEELMGSELFGGLDPHSMRRNVRDFSISGHYRKLLAKPLGPYSYRVQAYGAENEQFVQTDMDRLNEARDLEQAKVAAQRKLHANENADADAAKSDGGRIDHPMGLDGAAESKIQAVKDALLGTDASINDTPTTNNSNDTAAHTASVAASSDTVQATAADVQKEVTNEDAMDVSPAHVEQAAPPKDKIAIVLTLQLSKSTYATMALRELGKGGIRPYKPEYGSSR